MVTNTITVDRFCYAGHKWKQEMTVTEYRELLRTRAQYDNCPECRYADDNKETNDLLEQHLDNEIH